MISNLAEMRRAFDEASAQGEFVTLVKVLAAAKGDRGGAAAFADKHHASEQVKSVLKAGVPAGATDPANWAAGTASPFAQIVAGFTDSLRGRSLFFTLLNDGTLSRAPLQTRMAYNTAAATGWIQGQGKAIPLTRLNLNNQVLTAATASALIVVTTELLASTAPGAQELFARELRGAVADVVDRELFARLVVGAPTIAAGANPRHDLRQLLAAVNTQGEAHRLAWAMAVDVANVMSTLGNDGALIFRSMSPTGGQLLGLEALVTTQIEPGQLALIDGAGILAGTDTVGVAVSTQTAIEMSDTPTSDALAPAGATMTSMFQTDSTSIKVDVRFGVERVRPAFALLTDIGWDAIPSG